MKKILKDLAIFCILAIIIAGIILPRELNNLDEIWNFNFARNIANGLMPYRDFNMLQTPLLSMICGEILYLFGQELIVMRILAVILCASIIFLLYKILTTLKINEFICIILLFPIMYMYKDYFTIDYNYANILITLLITLLEIKYYKNESKIKDILFGTLVGLAILNKQTTGIVLATIFIFYKLLISNITANLELRLFDAIKVLSEYGGFTDIDKVKFDGDGRLGLISSELYVKKNKEDKEIFDLFFENFHIHISFCEHEKIFSIRLKKSDEIWRFKDDEGNVDFSHPINQTYEIYIWYEVPVLDVTKSVGSIYKNGTWDKYFYFTIKKFLRDINSITDNSQFNEAYK